MYPNLQKYFNENEVYVIKMKRQFYKDAKSVRVNMILILKNMYRFVVICIQMKNQVQINYMKKNHLKTR